MQRAVRDLANATLLRAAMDYVKSSSAMRRAIIKDLKSDWMDFFTDGMSIVLAEKLKKDPEEISIKVRQQYQKEEN